MLANKLSKTLFNLCHGRQLVYNACWEDPRLDRVALDLHADDRVLMITSAGCNALDYALDSPRHIYAVDMNYRQNALLELKQAAIRSLDFEDFFALFGQGRFPKFDLVYKARIRHQLSPASQSFWDSRANLFNGTKRRESFYFRGTAGLFAWLINIYIDRVAGIRGAMTDLLSAKTLEEQQEIYERDIKAAFWGPFIRWVVRRDSTMSLLGVPASQRRQLEHGYPGGIAQFIEDRLDTVFTQVSFADNYFWRVYLTGEYTRECCPSYLQLENFQRLKEGLVDRISTHTTTLLDFLKHRHVEISRYVLLDHMDWLHEQHHDILQAQWQTIVDQASPQARVIWRSAALEVDFIDPIKVNHDGEETELGSLLSYHDGLAEHLHVQDRVNTYASFYIADIQSRKQPARTLLQQPALEYQGKPHAGSDRPTEDTLPSRLVAHSG